jgi:hypothetical protein
VRFGECSGFHVSRFCNETAALSTSEYEREGERERDREARRGENKQQYRWDTLSDGWTILMVRTWAAESQRASRMEETFGGSLR